MVRAAVVAVVIIHGGAGGGLQLCDHVIFIIHVAGGVGNMVLRCAFLIHLGNMSITRFL